MKRFTKDCSKEREKKNGTATEKKNRKMAFGLLVKLSLVLVLMNVTVQGQHNVGRFSEEEIKQIVKLHNELRRSIHDAANMRELVSPLYLCLNLCVGK